MKKTFFKVTILSSLLAATLLYTGCKNDATPKIENTKQDETTGIQFHEPENAKEIKDKISNFRQRIIELRRGKDLSNGSREDKVTLDELQWGIEAVLNSTYGHADFDLGSQSVKTNTFQVDADSDGKVNNQDLLNAYNAAYESVLDHYNELQTNVKVPVLISIEKLETKERATTTTYQVTSVYATSSSLALPTTNCNVFNQSYDWYTAGTKLQDAVNARRQLPSGHAYFINLIQRGAAGYHSDLQAPANNQVNWRTALLYRNSNSFSNFIQRLTLDANDMNWYYCSLWQAIGIRRNTAPAVPSNYYLSAAWVIQENGYTGDDGLGASHRFWFIFGQSIVCPCPSPCTPSTPLELCVCC